MKNIPKNLQMYWDNSPMSRLQVFTIETFHNLNPDWKITVYTSEQPYTKSEKYIPDYTGKDYFNLIENMDYVKIENVDIDKYGISSDLHHILRSDIIRYYMLHSRGGVWSDFDVIWLKPIELLAPIIGNDNFMSVVCPFENRPGFSMHNTIGILISAPGHKLYQDLINRCHAIQANLNGRVPNHQEFGTCIWNSWFKSSADLIKVYPDAINVDYSTFYPYSIFNMEKLYKQIDLSVIDNRVVCLHWFNGHPLSKNYVNLDLYNDSNYRCSMTEILKREGYKG